MSILRHTQRPTVELHLAATSQIDGAWPRELADDLAAFVDANLVNRRDAFGCYQRDGSAYTQKQGITHARLREHFCGEPPVGLHTNSPDNTCLFVGFDIDCHDDDTTRAEQNERVARTIFDRLDSAGFHPLLEDSNGAGGFHIWVRFPCPVSAETLHAWASDIVRELECADVELFPKQAKAENLGNWLRLPGRHHKRHHWSRFYCPGEGWLEGEEAAAIFVNWQPAETLPDAPAMSVPRSNGSPTSTRDPREVWDPAKYFEAAMKSEVDAVRSAPEGTRNDSLYRAANALGRLVPHGLLGTEAHDALLRAAIDAGLGEPEARATIASGLKSGERNPADIQILTNPTSERTAGKSGEPEQTVKNHYVEFVEGENGKSKAKKIAIPPSNIAAQLDGEIKRMGRLLFVDASDIFFLDKPEHLFGHIGGDRTIRWAGGADARGVTMTPKTEFFAYLGMTADAYDAVERLPHEPALDNFYYAWKRPDGYAATGEYLDKLLAFFDNPETEVDRVLIRAMFLTPLWGGLPGTRPAFVLEADDRGAGKTTITEALGELYGAVEIEPGRGNESKIVTRLLSDDALVSRVVRCDNLKRGADSALLENLITTARISGHRLFHGEFQRPNTLTYVFTGNNLRLSRDLADRSVIIRLAKPKPRPGWREELFGFIAEHRDRIIADVVHALQRTPASHSARERWQSWTDAVLARCTDCVEAAVALNQNRRDERDAELEQAQTIEAYVLTKVQNPGDGNDYREPDGNYFVPSPIMRQWISDLLGGRWTDRSVSDVLKDHIASGRIIGITQKRRNNGRGYIVKKLLT